MKHRGVQITAIKNGLIWAGVNIVVFLVIWYIAPSLINAIYYTLFNLLLNLVFAIFFSFDMRRQAGGYWNFKQALLPIAITFLTTVAATFIFHLVFINYIDTSYPAYMIEKAKAFLTDKYRNMGISAEMWATLKPKMEERIEQQHNPDLKEALTQFVYAILKYFAFALVFAVIFTRKPNVSEK